MQELWKQLTKWRAKLSIDIKKFIKILSRAGHHPVPPKNPTGGNSGGGESDNPDLSSVLRAGNVYLKDNTGAYLTGKTSS